MKNVKKQAKDCPKEFLTKRETMNVIRTPEA